MKIKKLNMLGFSHDLLMVGFVAIFAIVGIGYVVSSSADSCPALVDGSGGCINAKGSTASAKLSCTITGLTKKPAHGVQLAPTLVIKNTGKSGATLAGNAGLGFLGRDGKRTDGGKGGPITGATLLPGTSVSIALPTYTTKYATRTTVKGVYTASSKQSPRFACSSTFALPSAPKKP